jgi:hypothetical protein
LGIASGDLVAARAWYSQAVTALARQSWPRVEAWHRILLAELCLDEGDHTAARPEIDAAADLVRRQRSRIAGARLDALAAQLDMSVL